MVFLKLATESVIMALEAMNANKLRTLLSLLGITIGIFAIISVFTIVDSLEKNVRNSIQSLGDNVVYVEKWPWEFGDDYPWWKYMNRPTAGVRDYHDIRKHIQSADAVAHTISADGVLVKAGNLNFEDATVLGVTYDYSKIKALELARGRYFTRDEMDQGKNLAVVGNDISTALFNGKSALFRTVDLRGVRYTVIGEFKKEGSSIFGESADQMVMVSMNSVRKYINVRRERFNPRILVKGKTGISNDQLKDELKGIMRTSRRLHPYETDNFALNESKMISAGITGMFTSIGLAGWFIGGFAILVGGFGIANIMFVSVKERTHIIGIQKSLGAKKYFILLQFLVESVVLCLVGGAIGLLIIFLGTLGLNAGFDLGLTLSLKNILLGLSVSAVIGILAGFFPAYIAAGMDPVEAIRTK